MYCNGCGTEVAEGHGFCGKCGRPVQGVPVRQYGAGRVANHISLLGALWIGYSILALVGGLVLLLVGRVFLAIAMSHVPPEGAPGLAVIRPLISVIGLLVLAKGVFSFAAGWGLLRRESWARILALVMACISLLNVPFGTAIGIYTLWVLMSPNAEQEYQALGPAD